MLEQNRPVSTRHAFDVIRVHVHTVIGQGLSPRGHIERTHLICTRCE